MKASEKKYRIVQKKGLYYIQAEAYTNLPGYYGYLELKEAIDKVVELKNPKPPTEAVVVWDDNDPFYARKLEEGSARKVRGTIRKPKWLKEPKVPPMPIFQLEETPKKKRGRPFGWRKDKF